MSVGEWLSPTQNRQLLMLAVGLLSWAVILPSAGVSAAFAATSPGRSATHRPHETNSKAPEDSREANTVELSENWRLIAAENIKVDDSRVSSLEFDTSQWHAVHYMPSTVLQALQDAGVYSQLNYGINLSTTGDLWRSDWWYRTTFSIPDDKQIYSLILKGINYRADIWVNGHKIADNSQVVGMYNSFEFDISKEVVRGRGNVLAIKITPERKILGVDGVVELGDTWHDWLNWKYIGLHDPQKQVPFSFPPDRNAGVWKRVFLRSTGPVSVARPYVVTRLPLPALDSASLTVYCDLTNHASTAVEGILRAEITRENKPAIQIEQSVSLLAGESRELSFSPTEFPHLVVKNPDLWWPYDWGKPNLYHLSMQFIAAGKASDTRESDFGIRQVVQLRDSDESFPEIGTGGNFYLQINGRDYLIRGAVYTPDLLFRNDPARDQTIMSYVKDLGLNMIRWELKIADDTLLERADREGVPVMLGWMCCGQWEHWDQWSAEDQWVARQSLRARIRELRSHPAVMLWANGSDGLPPDAVLHDYHEILKELHWQSAIVDTVSHVNRKWNGIHMAGPYVWHPPYYWFSEKYGPARGSSAEEGDNETIPPLESIKKFIPAEKLWPINEYWFFHSGAIDDNNTLADIQRVLARRYGESRSVEEFTRKAQLAHYEDVRAQFESYAVHWSDRKMLMHWMLNNHWPSFFGHLFDYYFKQGGGYFGAKKGLQRLSVVWDYYASGDRSAAAVYAVNQTPNPMHHSTVRVRVYDLQGAERYSSSKAVDLTPFSSVPAMKVPRMSQIGTVFFVRCELLNEQGTQLAENVYWQAPNDDDIGAKNNDDQFHTQLIAWADMSSLNQLPLVKLDAAGTYQNVGEESWFRLRLTNHSSHLAFFVRAEVINDARGNEILPIRYDDNYVTVFPHETRVLKADVRSTPEQKSEYFVRLEGDNVPAQVIRLELSSGPETDVTHTTP